MARFEQVHHLNVSGPLYVDTTCIDCGTCYHLGPDIFEQAPDDRSFVEHQPKTFREWSQAKVAIISCPTNSIGVKDPPSAFREAKLHLPQLISENVYYCGYTSRDSYGATTYFIRRPEGNVLIDSPRFHPTLVKELEALDGIKTMVLTHRDDVADHEDFARHFGCERVIHVDEVSSETGDVEKRVQMDRELDLDKDLKLISTPGHTKGHIVVLYKEKFLFTGDHVFFDQEKKMPRASRSVCWYSWPEQTISMRRLLQYRFEWLMPGHGGWGHLDLQKMHAMMVELVERMEKA